MKSPHIRALADISYLFFLYILIPTLVLSILYVVTYITGLAFPADVVVDLIVSLTLLIFLTLYLKIYTKERKNIFFTPKLQFRRLIGLIPLSIVARLPLVLFVVVLYLLFPQIGETIIEISEEGVDWQWKDIYGATGLGENFDLFVAFISAVVFAPIVEELFYRGIIFRRLLKTYSATFSIVLSSAIFALVHLHPGLYISTFIVGVMLGYIYHRWKNMLYPIIFHMLFNMQPFVIEIVTKYFS